MNPALSRLRDQIKQCEEFIALCERIKQLEKLQEAPLIAKKQKLEMQRGEAMIQLQMVCAEIQRLEEILSGRDRFVAPFEQEQINSLIRTARIREGTMRFSVENSTKQMESIDREIAKNALELEELYPKLEEGIVTAGLDPDTVGAHLAGLKSEKERLIDEMKSEVSTRQTAEEVRAQQSRKPLPVEGGVVRQSDFYELLVEDLMQTKKSVEVVTPYVSGTRAREIMAVLAQLVANGRNVTVYTKPSDEQDPGSQEDLRTILTAAHKHRLTVIQRSGLEYNAVFIDNFICWEGSINVMAGSSSQDTMRRTTASMHVRKLRHFILTESGGQTDGSHYQ
ncbi:MAG: hypothetical protein K2W95_27275 [Candidatus Obscuribacterales bacterium]|nr:hypothetical protein [Candidatus Obscuribacterales bacterium]